MMVDQLSALDVAFLCLESSAAPMNLGALGVFGGPRPVRPDRVVTLLGSRAGRVPRLRQRVRAEWFPPGGASWAEDLSFDHANHIRLHRLRSVGLDDLAVVSAELMAEPLDLSRPPWQLHVISGLEGGGFAVVAKFHHALSDAYGAMGLAQGLFDIPAHRGTTVRRQSPSPAPADASAPAARGGLASSTRPDRLVGAAIETASSVVSQSVTALGIAASVAARLRLPPASPLQARPTGSRRIILRSVGLADLQLIRHRHGGSVHDALLALVSGGMRRWLETRGQRVDGLRIRALIPASLRRSTRANVGGNQLSGYLCDLPVGEPDPAHRLHAIRTTMDRQKAVGPARGAGALPVLAGLLPPAVHRVATPLAARAAGWLFDLVITTVSLPAAPPRLGGAELRELYPLVPLAHGHALGIAFCRYRDTVHIGLLADSDALPDLEKFADALPAALAELSGQFE